MNISNRLREYYVFPAAGFTPFPDLKDYLTYEDPMDEPEPTPPPQEPSAETHWRIDGAAFGVYYWTIPTSLQPIPPMKIDLVIPDQTEWPPELWGPLGARDSTHMSDQRVVSLGISRHLCRALDSWWERTPNAHKDYKQLPFGSIIYCPQIIADIEDMTFQLVANARLEERLLAAEELREMWGLDAVQMPETIPVGELHWQRQLSASISLVTIAKEKCDRMQYVFKGRPGNPNGLYHEMKVLLTTPSHPNVIKGPLYLVTTLTKGREDHRVCGFLLPYHEEGALQEALPRMRQQGTLKLPDQLRWAKQLAAALVHIHSSPALFHSDLKMDNVLLATDGEGGTTAILSDLEQSRNFYNWAPPEVYYIEWIAELGHEEIARSTTIDSQTFEKFSAILNRYLASKGISSIRTQERKYDNPPHGWYFPWILSTPAELEASAVYCLGKVLWCIFEGEGDADIILGRSLQIEADRRFPEFHRTPEPLRDLIKHCTAGAREWKDGPMGIVRRGGRVYPLGRSGVNGEPVATLEETKQAIRVFWQREMSKAEKFVLAKVAYDTGTASETDVELLDYLRRPTLREVLNTLNGFSLPAL